ncbi:MAG TPA: anaerobic ribonucleoside-triphosphate reductase activating protein [Propionibacteriaceae bacterium]|nr:anaerobic ribonucleoside-triphosphate reductase activating protein [Propionibacteriaceae bacterium]
MLPVAGLTRLSSCDWPGRLVATVFVQGCPWRCTYCHNPDLIDPRTPGVIDFSEVIQHLEQRHGLLDGVVFTGGEPTGAPSLPAAIAEVVDRGFPVGLHTSGAHPARLTAVLDLVSWVGLDIKGLPQEYPAITGRPRAGQQAYDSLGQVLASGVDYEVRVTADPAHHTADGLTELVAMLRQRGVTNLVLQPVRFGAEASTAAADALLDQIGLPSGVSRR